LGKCIPIPPEERCFIYLYTHNAAHSQLAEAILNKLCGDRYMAFSAGTDPTQINPLVVSVMSEIDIDTSGYRSKALSIFKDSTIELCDNSLRSR
jgi:arsenate reductase